MQFDIIIVGGGMVGASLACALQSTPLKVALIDATPIPSPEDKRLIALNYSSYCLFKNLNLWPMLEPHAAPIHEVHASHRGHFGSTRLTANDLKLDTLGFVVPAKFINEALYAHLQKITLIRPAKLTELTQDTQAVHVTLNDARLLSGKIVIAADGTHSTIRELLNITTEKFDYDQSAIVTATELQRFHHHIAYERFQNKGAIAMLPLTGNNAATIWTADNETITTLMNLSDEAFLQTLQKHFGYRLGRLLSIEKRFIYPLQRIQAKQKIKQRVILIGNAAHTLHPIAAQGLNLALHEVASLAEYFSHQSLETLSLQNFSVQQQNNSMRLSHHLTSLFSNEFFPVNAARQIGMLGLDLCTPVKKRFIQQSIGRTGTIPFLLREQD